LTEQNYSEELTSQIHNILIDIEFEKQCAELNLQNINEEVIPNLTTKLKIVEDEIESMRSKQIKTDSMVHNLRNLSNELENKMLSFLNTSKQAQKDAHVRREVMSDSFSKRVEEISKRLKDLEVKKVNLNEVHHNLQKVLSDFAIEFEQQNNLLKLSSDDVSDCDEDLLHKDIEVAEEESRMIYEDYRSHIYKLEQKESQLQSELCQYVERFQELSSGLSNSNKSLSEHQKRVSELESTLTSLEGQQVKGKQILTEIKRVIESETKTCNNIRTSIDCMKSRFKKYKNMSDAFQNNIDDLKVEINFLNNYKMNKLSMK
jgi:chromosome segregation ATPase